MILTRTARSALERIRDGKPAFRTPIPWGRGIIGIRIAENRTRALSDLVQLRYLKRGPRGPTITQTGIAALEKLERFEAERAKPVRTRRRVAASTLPDAAAEAAFGVTFRDMAERHGVAPVIVRSRSYWLEKPLKHV